MNHEITTIAQLEAIYGTPHERALRKEIDHLNDDYQTFVRASPFVTLSSVGPHGTDVSPRGDRAGFVSIVDPKTLALPDRPGNNRIDTLRNIVADPRVSLLFLIPGVGEMLRVNGRATISAEPGLLARFAVEGKTPRTVVLIHIDAAYFHCSKAVVRSRLWDPDARIERDRLPSAGAMHRRLSGGTFDGESYDRDLPARTVAGLY
ncbi:pyridoxamine 5'-phosphate oxidase family protein [Burkholderia lata]|uniref:pyridoxamine 5'-phosphate oxidase family protein n=1 Tax=Burkholderia lata (strain ATCC 17760 / DSM 23089 / LMG 22485 / NCIMB 9086 / R18194 / 383) TaxID=482957 RepID=UPI00145490FA|nr:pyridoxamine 5'-phosphate oxidase family protein [Burkholderia lata]VWD14398.1 pyridoxamine 5'-phosphate oxidase family protein [Burkholderia lata]